MSTTTPACRLTVTDRREQKLNDTPQITASYDLPDIDQARTLAGLLLQRTLDNSGEWHTAIAGGVRHVTITPISSRSEP